MYKFIITIQCEDGTRDGILACASEVQAATCAEPGCVAYDSYTCTDNPDRLLFVEEWTDGAAHADQLEQDHTKDFISFHEQFHMSLTFEATNVLSKEDA